MFSTLAHTYKHYYECTLGPCGKWLRGEWLGLGLVWLGLGRAFGGKAFGGKAFGRKAFGGKTFGGKTGGKAPCLMPVFREGNGWETGGKAPCLMPVSREGNGTKQPPIPRPEGNLCPASRGVSGGQPRAVPDLWGWREGNGRESGQRYSYSYSSKR